MAQVPWGSDGPVSMPVTLDDADAIRVPMGGFCFTALGIRIDMTDTEREELIASGHGPQVDQ